MSDIAQVVDESAELFTMLDAFGAGIVAVLTAVSTLWAVKRQHRKDIADAQNEQARLLSEERAAQAKIIADERATNAATMQAIIDQLQEERKSKDDQLNREREQARADREQYEERIDQFWGDKAASRRYIHSLQDHIWQRREPPPPDPPEGYTA